MVVQARRRLTEAGVYGSRVIVHQRAPGDTGYPSGFADLIVSSRRLDQPGASRPGDGAAAEDRELDRLARPYGGAICVGRHEALTVRRRGEPSGAGRWTHQYADAANTSNSGDALAPGPLGMRWFREVDVELPSRHGRAPAPLCDEGRLFHAGLDGIVALDAFNGRELWRHPIPGLLAAYDGDELMGTAGTGGTLCLHAGSVYVRDKRRCLRLDAATGKELGEFRTPSQPDGRPGTWGYLAAAEGTLFGGVADDEHIVTYRYQKTTGDMTQLLTESRSLFALDARTGHLRWQYPAEHSLRHNAIAISEGRVFLIDRPLALFDREKKPETKEQALGRLLALDVQTGQVLWQRDDEIYGTLLAAGGPQGVLLMSYQPTRFRLDSELGGRMAAFRMSDGERLWDVKADYQSRPLINGAVVYAQGGAWNLLTGQSVPFEFQRSYGCGILATSQNLLLFRSATLGYFDLQSGRLANYGGIRPGCWINAIPASGLVLLPDASARCRCSYLNQAWIALAPASENEPPK
jgi:outer membrane protein assembly factor BamB